MWSTGGATFLEKSILWLLISIVDDVFAQPVTNVEQQQQPEIALSFRPSIAIVIGIFSIMFSITFLLLMYAKFCSTAAAGLYSHEQHNREPNSLLPNNRFSGIDKSIIESLPFFRFSVLKGSREGLECAVCLSKFEDSEVLRLLPKCKHAFHIDCVDRWLENHSSCPLCRTKIEVEDLTMFKYSDSSRFLFGDPSNRNQSEVELELFVEREVGNIVPSSSLSKFSIEGSFRKVTEWGKRSKRDHKSLLEDAGGDEERGKFHDHLHKFKHKIIVSDVVFKNRWSDLNYADLTSLNSDMIHSVSTRRFLALDSNSDQLFLPKSTATTTENVSSTLPDDTVRKIKDEIYRKRALETKMNLMITGNSNPNINNNAATSTNTDNQWSSIVNGKRCMSEITNQSRSMISTDRSRFGTSGDEKVKKVWLPIASRTVQLFTGRERESQPHVHEQQRESDS